MSYKTALAHLRMLGYSTKNEYSHVIFVHKYANSGGFRFIKETQHWSPVILSDSEPEKQQLADVLNELQQGQCPFKNAWLPKNIYNT